ncbi:HSP20-like chaperone, partial [Protomyces lactucae-debilis]
PRVRLSEEGERYKVEAEVPGFPKESLNLQFQDDYTLLLSGKYEQETREGPEQQELSTDQGQQQQQQQQAAKQDQGNGKPASTAVSKSGDKQVSTNIQQPRVWRNERISQSFQRQIVFPTAVNQDAVEASLDHGLLKLAVPKLAEEKHRK